VSLFMKRDCGVAIVLLMAEACWFNSFRSQAQSAERVVQTLPPPPATVATAAVAVTPQRSLDDYLKFDADDKTTTVTDLESEAHFTFTVTNISSGDVVINYMVGSCRCTVPQMPSAPWRLRPKEGGEFSAVMQMDGTPAGEEKFKTLTVDTDKGTKTLNVTAKVLPNPAEMTETARTNNMKRATADRQAVFKGDCTQCHAATAKDAAGHEKLGQDLYTAVCGVCHEAAHRATFVPDLHRLPEPTSAEFWRNWIMHGKPGSLMPAFAKVEGGILSDEQISSLVQYLGATIPAHPVKVSAPSSLKVVQ
jgi:mono/diheme cytochrome c family protein